MSEAKPTELLPCPFCGAEAFIVCAEDGSGLLDVECQNTGCLVQPKALALPTEDARTTWNTRATPSPAQADKRLAEIRELLPKLKEERTSAFCTAVTHREKLWLAEEAIKYLLSLLPQPPKDDKQ